MNLHDQVCSLELSKKLKELGIKQQSLFFWVYSPHIFDTFEWELMYRNCHQINEFVINAEWIAAFTVAELGELIPLSITENDNGEEYYKHFTGYRDFEGNWFTNIFDVESDKNEANSRAKTLIWLVENGHIKL